MYYVRRDGRIKGPLSREKLRSLREEKRLRMRDEIATTADGPWRPLRDIREEVLGGDESPAEERFPEGGELPEFDSGIWREEVEPEPPAPAGGAAPREPEPDGEWHDSLRTWLEGDDAFRGPFRPWMYVLGTLLLVVLGILALSVVLGTH
jgi:hypothetical protein